MATRVEKETFIAKIAPIARTQAAKHGNKIFASVCIAQACCESAYGTSKKMQKANAVFGFKVGKSKYHFGTAWKDKAYSTQTSECYDGKTYVKINDMFRAYDSISDAVEDYFDLLCTSKRYRYALNQASPLACITGIQKAPYATSPTYINTIMTIIDSNALTQYDIGASDAVMDYTIGKTYTLQADMHVRDAAGGNKLKYLDLTDNAKAHAVDTAGVAVLKKGTRVTCKEIAAKDNAVWIRIPSGWICGRSKDGKIFIQ